MSGVRRVIAGVCLGALLSPELVAPPMAAPEADPHLGCRRATTSS